MKGSHNSATLKKILARTLHIVLRHLLYTPSSITVLKGMNLPLNSHPPTQSYHLHHIYCTQAGLRCPSVKGWQFRFNENTPETEHSLTGWLGNMATLARWGDQGASGQGHAAKGKWPRACSQGQVAKGTQPRARSRGQVAKGTQPRASGQGHAAEGKWPRARSRGHAAEGKWPRARSQGQVAKGTQPRASGQVYDGC